MKLIYCLKCNDVVRLTGRKERVCECGLSGGKYTDDLYAEYWGEHALPIGFANSSFREAIVNRPHEGMGKTFTAFVMPTIIPTMKYIHK